MTPAESFPTKQTVVFLNFYGDFVATTAARIKDLIFDLNELTVKTYCVALIFNLLFLGSSHQC